jgi:hypothetical protein
MQAPHATSVPALIVAVAQLQSSPKPFTGGDAEEVEQSSEAGIAPHQSASDVQQQLKGLHSRAKSMEHELKMRVSKLDWQREFQAFETDLRAKHACEMRALQVSVDNKVKTTLEKYKQTNRLEMKIEIETMFGSLVDKTKELTIELNQHKHVLQAKIEEDHVDLMDHFDAMTKKTTTLSNEANMARITAQEVFEMEHSVKICAFTKSIDTKLHHIGLYSRRESCF